MYTVSAIIGLSLFGLAILKVAYDMFVEQDRERLAKLEDIRQMHQQVKDAIKTYERQFAR